VDDLGLTFDACNAMLSGEDPLEVLEACRETVVHAHLKDGTGSDGDYRITRLGEGNLDVGAILAGIEEHGIGTLSVEHPGRLEGIEPRDYLEQVQRTLEAPT